MQDLHCGSKKHAEVVEPGVIELKCDSRFCGHRRGVVVIHQFDTRGEQVTMTTRKFKNPTERGK